MCTGPQVVFGLQQSQVELVPRDLPVSLILDAQAAVRPAGQWAAQAEAARGSGKAHAHSCCSYSECILLCSGSAHPLVCLSAHPPTAGQCVALELADLINAEGSEEAAAIEQLIVYRSAFRRSAGQLRSACRGRNESFVH